jgi:excisionase family DNA binding protein
MNAPRLYTTREAAALLRVEPEAVRRRIRNRTLLATKPAGSRGWLIPESVLKAAVNEGANNANTKQG